MDNLSLYKKCVLNLTKDSGEQWRGNCPFHSENTKKNKSFCVNMGTGQYHCKSCGAKGNAITFAIHFGETHNDLLYNTRTNVYQKVELENVNKYHKFLLDNLENAVGFWKIEIIKLLKVGWDINKNNFVFPIFNEANNVINVRHHKGLQFKGANATLYPQHLLHNYDYSHIVIAEGEKDVISLLSNGFQAVTSTGGATVIPKDISLLIKFKKLYICLDNDNSGITGIDLWIKRIKGINPKSYIRVCDLSTYVDEGGDVTDYFSIEDKSQQTFKDEILDRSIFARLPGTDVPSFIKQILLSDIMKELSFRDQIVFFHLVHRAARYTFQTAKINGMQVRMRPGEFITSYAKFAKLCGKEMTAKMVIRATDILVALELIRKENLKRKRGMKFIVRNWIGDNGYSEKQSENEKAGILNSEFLSSEKFINKLNNGHSE